MFLNKRKQAIKINEKNISDWKETAQMNNSVSLYSEIQKNILHGIKVPHNISQMVIRKENDTYYLAVFVFFFTKEEIQNNLVNRPTSWALADIKTGEIVCEYDCKEKDFSDASYDIKYNVISDAEIGLPLDYYDVTFKILDSIRKRIIETEQISYDIYRMYMKRIVDLVPEDYQKFYWDLSI